MNNDNRVTAVTDPLGLLIFGAVCISFAAIFVKAIDPAHLGPTAIGFWRMLLGSVIFFGWSKVAGHSLRLLKSMFPWTALAGFLFFLDLFFWHRSIFYAGAGMATILANTQVFVTAVLSFFIFKEKLSSRFFTAAVMGIIGVVLLVGLGSDIELTSRYIRGILYGLGTGLWYACYLVTIKYSGEKTRRPHFLTMLAWISLFSAICLLISILIERETLIPTSNKTWFSLIGLALVSQSIGWWAIATSLPRIEGARGALVLLMQPVLATIWGVLMFQEYLTMIQIVGAVITLTAIYFGSIRKQLEPAYKNGAT